MPTSPVHSRYNSSIASILTRLRSNSQYLFALGVPHFECQAPAGRYSSERRFLAMLAKVGYRKLFP